MIACMSAASRFALAIDGPASAANSLSAAATVLAVWLSTVYSAKVSKPRSFACSARISTIRSTAARLS